MLKNTGVRTALKLSVAFLFSFVALEAILLIFNDAIFSNSFNVFDPDMGFRVRPYAWVGHDRANEFGFNDRDYPHERRPGTYRILFLSDSYNWMGGRYCNYTALLRRRFEAEFGTRVEVIDAGYSGTHTGEQLPLLKKFGLQYNPDLVVLGFDTGNDFFDAHPKRKRIVYGGALTDIYTDRNFYTTIWGQPLIFRSRLLLFLRERWLVYRYFKPAEPQRPRNPDLPAPVQPDPDCAAADAHLAVSLARDQYLELCHELLQFDDPQRAPIFRSFEKYIFDSLLEMRDVLARRRIGFMVAAYPASFQVDPELRKQILGHFGRQESDYDWDRAQNLLGLFCRENSIEFHDLLPVFRDAQSKGAMLYRYNDDHWSATGNELAARYFHDLLFNRIQ